MIWERQLGHQVKGEPDPSVECDTDEDDTFWPRGQKTSLGGLDWLSHQDPVNKRKEERHMARLIGVDLPARKAHGNRTYLHLRCWPLAGSQSLEATGIDPQMKSKDLTDEQTLALRDWIEANLKVEGDLRREVQLTFAARWKSVATREFVTARVFPSTGNAPIPMRAPVRVHARPLPARRRPKRTTSQFCESLIPPKIRNQYMAPKGPGAKKVRRKEKKNVAHGHAHIKSTFNNTIVSITDPTGAVIAWAVAGQVGFKGSRKSTPFAAQLAAESAARRAMEHGMRKVDVFVKGPGSGRETAIRSLQATGLEVGSISDVTPVPHNGTRPPKRRRV